MDRTTLTQSDRNELFAAYVERYRLGEIGPATFRKDCELIGVDRSEIDAARDRYSDECTDGLLHRLGGHK